MKHKIPFLPAILFSAIVCFATQAAPLKVSVSLPSLKRITEQIGGNEVTVSAFMGADDDPHTFAPTPKAVARLSESDLFITATLDFEQAVTQRLRRMKPKMHILRLNLEKEQGTHEQEEEQEEGHDKHEKQVEHKEETGHGHGHHHHDGEDPHTWLSLPNLIEMGEMICHELSEIRPQSSQLFDRNYAKLKTELQNKHQEMAKRLQSVKGTTFYVYHPALTHFAENYGLSQKVIESDGKAPTPKTLLKLIEEAKKDKVKIIFVQPQFNQRAPGIIARKIGARLVVFNPLPEDVPGELEKVAEALKK